jgi:hypothetical protein
MHFILILGIVSDSSLLLGFCHVSSFTLLQSPPELYPSVEFACNRTITSEITQYLA